MTWKDYTVGEKLTMETDRESVLQSVLNAVEMLLLVAVVVLLFTLLRD